MTTREGHVVSVRQAYAQYEEALRLPQGQRDMELARLMTCLEREFHIPLVSDSSWEKEHRPIIALYRVLSLSRDL